MKKLIYTLIATGIIVSCKSLDKQNAHIDKEISVKKLRKDVDYVERKLFNLHPDADWYISKEKLHKKFDSLKETIVKPMKPNDFYFKISPIVAEVRQGHMAITPLLKSYSNDQKKKYKKSKHPLNGLEYIYEDDRLILVKNKSEIEATQKLQVGSEILSINGITPKELYAKYRSTYTSDGFNETFIMPYFARRANNFYSNEVGFVDSLSIEIKCADSLFTFVSKRKFEEKVKKSKKDKKEENKSAKDSLTDLKNDSISKLKKQTDSLKFANLSKKEIKLYKKKEKDSLLLQHKLNRWKGYDSKEKTYTKQLSFPVENDSTSAVLKLTTFSKGSAKIYDTIFKQIKHHNVQNLIIDLRGNTGGRLDDIYKLSQYLNEKEYYFVDPSILTKKRSHYHIFDGKSVIAQTLLFPFWGTFSTIRYFQTTKNDKDQWIHRSKSSKLTKPKEHAYTNKIYVLTDGLTFSAGAIIASHIHGIENSTFVGEETGGTFNGTVAGQMPQLELPNSKLRWRVGLMSIKPFNKTEKEGYGVIPDVEIKESVEDKLESNDKGLDWILEDIKNKKSSK